MSVNVSVALEDGSMNRLSELLTHEPGAELIAALAHIDPLEISRAERIDYLALLRRCSNWLESLLSRAVLSIAGQEPHRADEELPREIQGVDEAPREEISAALRLSSGSAQREIDIARALHVDMPALQRALESGDLSRTHARIIIDESHELRRLGIDRARVTALTENAISYSELHTPAQLARHMRSEITKLAPMEAEIVHAAARGTRRVICYPEPDGMATILALLPADAAQRVMNAINRIVRTQDAAVKSTRKSAHYEDSIVPSASASTSESASNMTSASIMRSPKSPTSEEIQHFVRQADLLETRRADAFVLLVEESAHALLEGAGTPRGGDGSGGSGGTAPDASFDQSFDQSFDLANSSVRHRGVSAQINVTIDLPSLLGLADTPGELLGYGAIPASVARELAMSGKWRRFITDPTNGHLIDIGRSSYTPSAALRELIIARDGTCRFPGCAQPPSRSDLDHAVAWSEGGETDRANLGLLCRRHHRLKTHDGWSLKSNEDGSCTWTAPSGHRYHVPARTFTGSSGSPPSEVAA